MGLVVGPAEAVAGDGVGGRLAGHAVDALAGEGEGGGHLLGGRIGQILDQAQRFEALFDVGATGHRARKPRRGFSMAGSKTWVCTTGGVMRAA